MKLQQLPAAALAFGLSVPLSFAQGTFDLFGSTSSGSIFEFNDLSANGAVAVGASSVVGPLTWSASGGTTPLPPLPNGFTSAGAVAVSADGATVFGSMSGSFGLPYPGYRWNASTGYTLLDGLGASAGVNFARPLACKGDGSLVAGYSETPLALDQLTAWDLSAGTAPIAVPYVAGDNSGVLYDIANSTDLGVGTSFVDGQFGSNAFRWTLAGGSTRLTPPIGWPDAGATAISGDGTAILGFAQRAQFGDTALVRWNSAGLVEVLHEFPAGSNSTRVRAANQDGTAAVGTYGGSLLSSTTGFYWSEATGFQDLRDFLRSRGVATPIFSSDQIFPQAMSSDGNVIAGFVRRSVGGTVTHGFVATLAPSPPADIGVSYCGPSVPNSVGESPGIDAIGSTSVADDDFVLAVSGLPPRSFGALLVAQTQGAAPGFGGGVGTLCLGPSFSLVNAPDLVRFAGIFRRTALRLDPTFIPTNAGTLAIQSGQTWNFQYWYRDRRPSGATTNLTSARTITFQ